MVERFALHIPVSRQSRTRHEHAHRYGQGPVTLRKDLLEHLGVHPGGKLTVDKLPGGRIEVKAVRPTGKISDVFGILKAKRKGRSLSIEDMNEIIARGWAGKR